MRLTQNVLLIGGVKRWAVSGRPCRSASSAIFSRVQGQSCPQSDELDRRRYVWRYSTVLVSHDTGCGLGRDRGGDSVVAMNPVGLLRKDRATCGSEPILAIDGVRCQVDSRVGGNARRTRNSSPQQNPRIKRTGLYRMPRGRCSRPGCKTVTENVPRSRQCA